MGWTRLEPPPKGAARSAPGLHLRLRKTRRGMTMRLVIGTLIGKRLTGFDQGWAVGGKIEACLGNGADRGSLRLMPAQDGDFYLRDAPGRGKGLGGFALQLPPHFAWADEPGTWRLPDGDLIVSEVGALTIALPEAALTVKAHALPLRKAS